MGNSEASEKKADEELANYLTHLTLYRKEHSYNLGKDIMLYKPSNSSFEEDLILLLTLDFEEEEDGHSTTEEFVKAFKSELNLRKNFDSLYLSKLLFINYKKIQTLCAEKMQCRLTFEHSDYDLYKLINESRMVRSSQLNKFTVMPDQAYHFLHSIADALLCLKKNGKTHGFIQPVNVLVYNKSAAKPVYKLLDVGLISGYESAYDRMMVESDYLAPLDPDLLNKFEQQVDSIQYHESSDIWALGWFKRHYHLMLYLQRGL